MWIWALDLWSGSAKVCEVIRCKVALCERLNGEKQCHGGGLLAVFFCMFYCMVVWVCVKKLGTPQDLKTIQKSDLAKYPGDPNFAFHWSSPGSIGVQDDAKRTGAEQVTYRHQTGASFADKAYYEWGGQNCQNNAKHAKLRQSSTNNICSKVIQCS